MICRSNSIVEPWQYVSVEICLCPNNDNIEYWSYTNKRISNVSEDEELRLFMKYEKMLGKEVVELNYKPSNRKINESLSILHRRSLNESEETPDRFHYM